MIFKQEVDIPYKEQHKGTMLKEKENDKKSLVAVMNLQEPLACDNVCDYGTLCAQPCVGNKEYNA